MGCLQIVHNFFIFSIRKRAKISCNHKKIGVTLWLQNRVRVESNDEPRAFCSLMAELSAVPAALCKKASALAFQRPNWLEINYLTI